MKRLLPFLVSILFVLLLGEHIYAQHPTRESFHEALQEKIFVKNWDMWRLAMELRSEKNGHQNTQTTYQNFSTLYQQLRIGHTQKPESEIHAAMHPIDTNRMAIAVMRYDHTNVVDPLSFSLYNTENFGETWFESSFRGRGPGNQSLVGGGDPMLAYTSDGTLHFVRLLVTLNGLASQGKIGLYHATSEDNGISWSNDNDPIVSGELSTVGQGIVQINAEDRLVDKPWLGVDQSGGPFNDALYLVYTDIEVGPDTLRTIKCVNKRRNVSRFSKNAVTVNSQDFGDIQFPTVDIDHEGTIHVCFWGTTNQNPFALNKVYSLFYTQSTNGGSSFAPERVISNLSFPRGSILSFPKSNIQGVKRLYPAPQLRVDKTDGPHAGNIYVTWMARGINEQISEGYDIYFARSTDAGNSWSDPMLVNNDHIPDAHQFFPSMEVSREGTVVMTWYDRRIDPFNVFTHYYLAFSQDGGHSFNQQFPVSELAADFEKVGKLNNDFGVGEYTQVLAAKNTAIPIWADARKNNGEVKVYAAFVPIQDQQSVSVRERTEIHADLPQLDIFPNPSREKLIVTWEQERPAKVGMAVYSILGKKLITIPNIFLGSGTHSKAIQVEHIPQGVYFLHLDMDGQIASKSFEVIH